MSEITRMVSDLHRLRSASINVVLHKLEDVQTNIALWEAHGAFQKTQIASLKAMESVLREVIREMWEVNFGEGAAR